MMKAQCTHQNGREPGRRAAPRQGSEFVLASAARGCELARVPCGSWRRPLAFTQPAPAAPAAFALAFVQGRALQVRRRCPRARGRAASRDERGGRGGAAGLSDDGAEAAGGGGECHGDDRGSQAGGAACRAGAGGAPQDSGTCDGGARGGGGCLPGPAGAACQAGGREACEGGCADGGGPGAPRAEAPAAHAARAPSGAPGTSADGGGRARCLRGAHHGLDVTCALALPLGPEARRNGADSPLGAGRPGRTAGAEGRGDGGRAGAAGAGRTPPVAVLTGSDDGTVRRLLLAGRGGGRAGSPGRAGRLPGAGPAQQGTCQRAGGATRCDRGGGGGMRCAAPSGDGAGGGGGAAALAEVGAHVAGTTVKALAAVPWPPGSGARPPVSGVLLRRATRRHGNRGADLHGLAAQAMSEQEASCAVRATAGQAQGSAVRTCGCSGVCWVSFWCSCRQPTRAGMAASHT